jgi:hypothetical protein
VSTLKADQFLKVSGIAVAVWGLLSIFGILNAPVDHSGVSWVSMICGFSFLGFCMAAWRNSPGRLTRVLALVGLGSSLVFFTGPGFESTFLGAVFSIVRSGFVLAGFAAMLHLLLLFPEPSPSVAKTRNPRSLYVPAFLFWLWLSYRALFAPESEGAINTVTYVFTGLIMAGYFLLGVIIFLRKYIRVPKDQRAGKGMNVMLFGSILGFLPAVIGYLPALSSMPGNRYFFVSMAVLPIAWSRAVQLANNSSGTQN